MISFTENFGYHTKKFTDIFPNEKSFINVYTGADTHNADEKPSPAIPTTISEESAKTLYYLLYARHGNSHIYNTDESQFKYKLLGLIFQYGPTWEKRLEIQKRLRNLTESELLQGSKAINNQAMHDGSAPSTQSLDELNYINEQHTTNYKKSKMGAYAELYAILRDDVTERFLNRFKSLFIPITSIQEVPYFITEDDN